MTRTPPSGEQKAKCEPSPVPRNQPVTEYRLTGEDLKIVLHDGPGDAASLEYNGKIFRGRALYHDQTALGRVISIHLESIPDLHTVFLSLAVPEANRPSDQRAVAVSTFATITTTRTSIGGPGLVSGQIRTYQVVPLKGDAA
jgi:hypothetical protein